MFYIDLIENLRNSAYEIKKYYDLNNKELYELNCALGETLIKSVVSYSVDFEMHVYIDGAKFKQQLNKIARSYIKDARREREAKNYAKAKHSETMAYVLAEVCDYLDFNE